MFTPDFSRAKGTQEIGFSGIVIVALSRELSAKSVSGVLAHPASRLQKAAAAASRMKDPTINKAPQALQAAAADEAILHAARDKSVRAIGRIRSDQTCGKILRKR